MELAAKLVVNAEVSKLAGIIAYRRGQLDISRTKFQESRNRNAQDCETGMYLGVVLSQQETWSLAINTLLDTDKCLADSEERLKNEIEQIRASTDPPERQARQIDRREQQLTSGRRMLATSWFNMAVGYYNLSLSDEARHFADKVKDDAQFGERSRELLSHLR